MIRKIGLSLCVTIVLALAVIVSSALLTASDARSSNISMRDVNNDGLVDIVDSNEKIFWNRGDNQFLSNDMIITDYNLTKEGLSSYYAFRDPINATSLNWKPPLFVFNSIHIEEKRSSIINIYNLSATFYENNGQGTYLPKWFINPAWDFNLFLHMHPNTDNYVSRD